MKAWIVITDDKGFTGWAEILLGDSAEPRFVGRSSLVETHNLLAAFNAAEIHLKDIARRQPPPSEATDLTASVEFSAADLQFPEPDPRAS